MRVIAGSHKGRPLVAPKGDLTRPTSDRVKEAMFAMIGPYFAGGAALDLFAGTGALGIEALSRGVDHAVFVDKVSTNAITLNVERLGLQASATVLRGEYPGVLARLQAIAMVYDLVFLDPPYRLDLCAECMQALAVRQLLSNGAVVVAEVPSAHETQIVPGFTLRRDSRYGDTKVCIYQYAWGF